MMKKALLLLSLALLLSGCGASDALPDAASVIGRRHAELIAFADASLMGALDEIVERYQDAFPWIRVRVQYGSSGVLSQRARDGAECDLFLSAASGPMDALDGAFRGDLTRNPDGLDMLSGARVNLLKNEVVLAVPNGNPKGVRDFAHMSALIRRNGFLAVAPDPGDPLGACAERIFSYYYLSRSAAARGLTFASDAKEALTRIQSGMADGAILYRTDADGLFIADTADASVCGDITYCAAALAGSERLREASDFLEYLTGSEASEIFARAGFTPLSGETEDDGEYWEAALPEDSPWEAALPEEPESDSFGEGAL